MAFFCHKAVTKNCSILRFEHAIVAVLHSFLILTMNLNTQILIAAIAGVGLGLLLTSYPQADFAQTTLYVLGILSSIFIGLLKMLLMIQNKKNEL